MDTGAAVSVISEETYKELFSNLALKKAPVCLKTFTGEQIPILGEIAVDVCYQKQRHQLSLIVVKGKGHNLFGRDWLMHFQLDWKTIGLVSLGNANAKVNVLLKKYNREQWTPYGEQRICFTPLLLRKTLNSSDTNCGPLSLTTCSGSP